MGKTANPTDYEPTEYLQRKDFPRVASAWLNPRRHKHLQPFGELCRTQDEARFGNCDFPEVYNDGVMTVMIQAIKKLEKNDMWVAGCMIRIYSLTQCSPVWPLNGHNKDCNVKLYGFKEASEKFPMTVRVTVVDLSKPGPLTVDRILVRIRGDWMPWKTGWLNSLITPVKNMVAMQCTLPKHSGYGGSEMGNISLSWSCQMTFNLTFSNMSWERQSTHVLEDSLGKTMPEL